MPESSGTGHRDGPKARPDPGPARQVRNFKKCLIAMARAELQVHADCPDGIVISVLRDGDSWEFRAKADEAKDPFSDLVPNKGGAAPAPAGGPLRRPA